MNRQIINVLQYTMRGAAQVMFQDNPFTGILFLTGIIWGAVTSDNAVVAWGALVGLAVSTLAGRLFGRPRNDLEHGLWGFNGILVGCALPTFLGNTPAMWFTLIFGAMMTIPLRMALNNLMRPYKINSMTAPFVAMTWIILLSSRVMHAIPNVAMATPSIAFTYSDFSGGNIVDYLVMWLKGVAQVFLIDSWITGLLFLLGLLIANRWAALWAGIGSALSLAMAVIMGSMASDITHGLYSFSAVLTAIALGSVFYKPSWRSAAWTVCGITLTLLVQAAVDVNLSAWGLPSLTAPFCIATWLCLLPRFRFKSDTAPDHSTWHNKGNTSRQSRQRN